MAKPTSSPIPPAKDAVPTTTGMRKPRRQASDTLLSREQPHTTSPVSPPTAREYRRSPKHDTDGPSSGSQGARNTPAVSAAALEIQSITSSSSQLRPSALSPAPSNASLTPSNLPDAESLASSAVYDDDEAIALPNSLPRSGAEQSAGKKSSHRLVTRFLARTQSIRSDEAAPRPKQRTGSSSQRHLSPVIRTRTPLTDDGQQRLATPDSTNMLRANFSDLAHGAKTAPLEPERGFRNAMSSSDHRNRSADRQPTHSGGEDYRKPSMLSSTFHLGNKTIDGVRHAGGNMFRKFRTTSVEKPPVPLIKRQMEVIRLPLAEQARITRLAKRYSDARDKTQFWLPSLPYRCIDYLNMHAVDEVGIYRQSGSRIEVDRFLAKFDTHPFDADLLGDTELYDVHIVSSVFKDWLRFLPEPIIPEAVQARIHTAINEDPNQRQCPEGMKDELSNLPPHNYYLLFAITCHISLLHSNAAKNLMTFENLVTCFMRSLQVDTSIFKYLILDWRSCWRGCKTEQTYLAEERKLEAFEADRHRASEHAIEDGSEGSKTGGEDERAFSSGSSRPPGSSNDNQAASKGEQTRGMASKVPGRYANTSDGPAASTLERSPAVGTPPPVLQPLSPIPPMQM